MGDTDHLERTAMLRERALGLETAGGEGAGAGLRQLAIGLAVGAGIAITGCQARPEADARESNQSATPERRPATPARTGFADVEGGRLHYQVHGDLASGKTPLLVLHGTFMSGDAMLPVVEQFARTRPVIAVDQRGHGRSGNLPGPITYQMLADDAARVLDALKVPSADVLGYSMGGTAALFMAIRHPDKVGRQVIVSAPSGSDGWYPVVRKSMAQMTPEMFTGSPLEAEYRRLSPTPDAFPTLVGEMRDMERSYDQPDAALRAIAGKTMIVVGDADGLPLEHAIALFRLRGGGGMKAAAQGFLAAPPRARLAVLPATSHIGMMAQGKLLAEIVTPFLDDAEPVMAPGFLPENP